jgi:hypothetical protein
MLGMIDRIGPQQAKRDMASGALLVCAYDDDEKCRQFQLDRSVPFSQIKRMENTIPKGQEIIFYCA